MIFWTVLGCCLFLAFIGTMAFEVWKEVRNRKEELDEETDKPPWNEDYYWLDDNERNDFINRRK